MYVRCAYVGFINEKSVVVLAVNRIETTAIDYCYNEMCNNNLTLYLPCIMFQCVDKLTRCNTSYE